MKRRAASLPVAANPLPAFLATIGEWFAPINAGLSALLMGRELTQRTPRRKNPAHGAAYCDDCDEPVWATPGRWRAVCPDCGALVRVERV